MTTMNPQSDIRIGTLVKGSETTPDMIRQILPHGFESFSITFWQTLGEVQLDALADAVNQTLSEEEAVISSLAVFGNPLEEDEKADLTRQAWEAAIRNAHRFGCDLVAGFTGRLRGKPIPESLDRYKEVFGPLADLAGELGVRIAFENCAMGGTWKKGDWNIAHNPAAWELMFETLPRENIGLEWEPCHQLVGLIDPMPQLDEWKDRIFHVHGKDATVRWDRIRKQGIYGAKPIAYHRTPGFGDSNWTDIISILRMNGYTGFIDIEGWHDPVYKNELEMTGQVYALNYLKQCRGGAFVSNPE